MAWRDGRGGAPDDFAAERIERIQSGLARRLVLGRRRRARRDGHFGEDLANVRVWNEHVLGVGTYTPFDAAQRGAGTDRGFPKHASVVRINAIDDAGLLAGDENLARPMLE